MVTRPEVPSGHMGETRQGARRTLTCVSERDAPLKEGTPEASLYIVKHGSTLSSKLHSCIVSEIKLFNNTLNPDLP